MFVENLNYCFHQVFSGNTKESKQLGPYRKEGYWQEKGQFYSEEEPPPECPFHKGEKDVS